MTWAGGHINPQVQTAQCYCSKIYEYGCAQSIIYNQKSVLEGLILNVCHTGVIKSRPFLPTEYSSANKKQWRRSWFADGETFSRGKWKICCRFYLTKQVCGVRAHVPINGNILEGCTAKCKQLFPLRHGIVSHFNLLSTFLYHLI